LASIELANPFLLNGYGLWLVVVWITSF